MLYINIKTTKVLCSISIEVDSTLIEYGKSGVNIKCVANSTNLIGITSIQLRRSESNVVSVSKYTVVWQDKELENKTEVTVNASIRDVSASFLHLEIPGSVDRYPKDTGSYQCILSGVTASVGASIYTSQSIVLNITGFPYLTTYIFSTNHARFEVSVQKGYLEFSTESYKNNTSLQNENESFLILYRKIITPVGTLISCVFAFIIVRELRLHYVASKATATSERTEKKYTNGVYIV
uniref:Ig-like domain-containing protein n=1 Tax=Magallana gigas TaxID=29159 RepID=A0A8W8LW38_MAGGI